MNELETRRAFLKQGAAVALGGTAGSAFAADDKPATLPIIDTHQHLWDLSKFRLPWTKDYPTLAKNYLMEDYLKATEGLNIVKAVYMEVDVAPEQQLAEAKYVIDLCEGKKSPTVAAVISGRPASDGFRDYILRFKGSRIVKGVREVLHNEDKPRGYCLRPSFIKGIRLLGELGMSFDLVFRSADLSDAAKLIDACPETRFILDHCGNANPQAADLSQWKRDIADIARRKKVVCKVSGIIASVKPGKWKAGDLAPIVNHVIEVFGPDRVMFGGDWPVCTLGASYKEWFSALNEIVKNRPAQFKKKLFHDNAERFYGLA